MVQADHGRSASQRLSRRQLLAAGAAAAAGLTVAGGSRSAAAGPGRATAVRATPTAGTQLNGMSHYIATVTSLESADRGFRQGVGQLGGVFQHESYDGDQQQLLSQSELFSSLGVNGVFAFTLSDALVDPYVTQLAAQGIAYVNSGNRVPWLSPLAPQFQGLYIAQLGGSFAENGYAAATAMFERGGGAGKAILLQGTPGAANDAYDFGYRLALEQFPDIEVVAEGMTDWDRTKANEVAQTLLSSNPDVKFIVGYNDSVALGALAAARALNLTDFFISGCDGDPEFLGEIAADERCVATSALRIDYWGVLGAVLLFDHLNGIEREPLECILDVDAIVVDTPESAEAMLDLVGSDDDPLPYDATRMSRFLQGDSWEYPHRVRVADPVNFDWGDAPGVVPTERPADGGWSDAYDDALEGGRLAELNTLYEEHTVDIYDGVRSAATYHGAGALGLFETLGVT